MKIYQKSAALTALLAGGLHLFFISFEHWTEFPPLEFIFFIGVGLAQILWAILFYRKPEALSYYCGVFINGGVPLMWLLTRFYRAPFMEGAEHIDALGLVTQFFSILALLFSSFVWFKYTKKNASHAASGYDGVSGDAN